MPRRTAKPRRSRETISPANNRRSIYQPRTDGTTAHGRLRRPWWSYTVLAEDREGSRAMFERRQPYTRSHPSRRQTERGRPTGAHNPSTPTPTPTRHTSTHGVGLDEVGPSAVTSRPPCTQYGQCPVIQILYSGATSMDSFIDVIQMYHACCVLAYWTLKFQNGPM